HEVGFLDQDHAARTKRGRHSLESQALVGQPLDEPTRVDEVEAGGKCVGHDVVLQYLKARAPAHFGLEEVRLQVRGDHFAAGCDLLGEPECHRPASGTDFEATGTSTDAETSQVGASAGIEGGLEAGEPDPLFGPAVVVGVVLHHPFGPPYAAMAVKLLGPQAMDVSTPSYSCAQRTGLS